MDTYEVIVGNIGVVHRGNDLEAAKVVYRSYVSDSKACFGRASRENVYLCRDELAINNLIAVYYAPQD